MRSGTNDESQVEIKEIEASLALEVTPQVTNEGSISLEISLIKRTIWGLQTTAEAAPPTRKKSPNKCSR